MGSTANNTSATNLMLTSPSVTYSAAETPDWQPYRFSGKESLTRVGLDLYDFGARMFSPFNMRWMTMDPLAEKYYHISPYAYCAGDPINLVDPDGLSIRALGTNSIDIFLNMLSDEELRYISFDSNGVLNDNVIASYSGDSILLNTIKTLSSSTVLYDFMISDNDGEEQFYDIDNKESPGSFYYGITRYPGATNKPSIDNDVHVFTASFLGERKKQKI